jgi:hypothetical protein
VRRFRVLNTAKWLEENYQSSRQKRFGSLRCSFGP